MSDQPILALKDTSFKDLLTPKGLSKLDQKFMATLKATDQHLHDQLLGYRKQSNKLSPIELSECLIQCAKILETFIASLFDIENALAISQAKTTSYNPIATFKKYYVQKRAKRMLSKSETLPSFASLNEWLQAQLNMSSLQSSDRELAVSLLGVSYLDDPEKNKESIDQLANWCTQALVTPEGRQAVLHWTAFKLPKRTDFLSLVNGVYDASDPFNRFSAEHIRHREGFDLTDPRMSAREAQDEINYCIYCHDHEGDFCTKGFPVKKGDPSQGYKKNPLDIILTGCPLEEKISEMHLLKREGHTIAALAMVMIDNPMCPATGHRICNDCMKACIYQKQDPVNIPQIETRVLIDVLDLPWGVEIYDLFTRWHPLRQTQWVMKPYQGKKVMIAGMGPAGFTLAHHLLLEGLAVVGFDGLKMEPLDQTLLENPIYRYESLKEALDERVMAGFGGVAEYGITSRWDKNFLKLIYLSLSRRPHFQVFGGVRFGGTIRVEDVWEMGFDHLALAVGAGLPQALAIPNSMNPGMRQANDFLMALQLGSAAKKTSITNLQISMPAIVIGGGLTGVDTATELQAYYIAQVEKIGARFDTLKAIYGEDHILKQLDKASTNILFEYLAHRKLIQAERERAKKANMPPDFQKLIRAWGGVTIVYRRSMQESPAYLNNHEELQKALEEGIYYLEGLEPYKITLDEYGHTDGVIFKKRIRDENGVWQTTDDTITLPAKSVLAATGTKPNTAYEFEHRGTFHRVKQKYIHYEEKSSDLKEAANISHCKETDFGPFTSYQKEDYRVSLIGDTHPVFHGSVVKAIASAMRTYPKILAHLEKQPKRQVKEDEYNIHANKVKEIFETTILEVKRRSKKIVELTLKAPLRTKHFEPGHFYRLQNLEKNAPIISNTLLQMEPLPLVAYDCNKEKGILKLMVFEDKAASKLCRILKEGETVSLMGPTGVRTKLPKSPENVLIIGQLKSLPFVLAYGKALKQKNCKVYYIGQFEDDDALVYLDELKDATDVTYLSLPNSKDIFNYLTEDFSLNEINRIHIVGDSQLLKAFCHAKESSLKPYLNPDTKIFGAVFGNMQCMLKGVCAQCLQWQIDPKTGERTKAVFACSWQNQPLEVIDIDHSLARTQQNALHEAIHSLWVDHVLGDLSRKR